jgi:hypothetical protein
MEVNVVIDPAFNYARDNHDLLLESIAEKAPGEVAKEITFYTRTRMIGLRAAVGPCDSDVEIPEVDFEVVRREGRSPGVQAHLYLQEGQRVSFLLRDVQSETHHTAEHITPSLLDRLQQKTKQF